MGFLNDRSEDPRLALAISLVRQAGRYAMGQRKHAAVSWKGPGERVTDVDVAIQSRMIREVLTWFPGDGILAEEGVPTSGADREFVWIVDPLDGTNNYALGLPCFAVSLGLFRSGSPYAGVVHDPNTGVIFWAVTGRGAFQDDRPLAVEARPLTEASNLSVRVPVEPRLAPLVARWMERYKFRGFGSSALHLCYAALGAIDVVVDHRAALWDIAGGAAIVLEAGGRISDPVGMPLFPLDLATYGGGPVPFVAGNPVAHGAVVRECRELLEAQVVGCPDARWC